MWRDIEPRNSPLIGKSLINGWGTATLHKPLDYRRQVRGQKLGQLLHVSGAEIGKIYVLTFLVWRENSLIVTSYPASKKGVLFHPLACLRCEGPACVNARMNPLEVIQFRADQAARDLSLGVAVNLVRLDGPRWMKELDLSVE